MSFDLKYIRNRVRDYYPDADCYAMTRTGKKSFTVRTGEKVFSAGAETRASAWSAAWSFIATEQSKLACPADKAIGLPQKGATPN
jgi:hypothetical protein